MTATTQTPHPKPECDAACIKVIIDAMLEVMGAAMSLAMTATLAGHQKTTVAMVNDVADMGREFVAKTKAHKATLGFPSAS